MKDGDLEATHFGETWIHVERAAGVKQLSQRCPRHHSNVFFVGLARSLLVIATQAVNTSLLLRRLLLDDNVGRPTGRLVRRSAGTPVGWLLLSAKAAAAAKEDGRFIVEDVLARLSVDRSDAMLDNGRVALVHDLDELGLGNQASRGRHGVLADFEVLFAVQEHHGVEVGHQRIKGEWSLSVKGRDDTV